MSTADSHPISQAELRRRVRAAEAVQVKTRELAAAEVLVAREAARKAALAKDEADRTAREAVAATLRLFNDPCLVPSLLNIPVEDLERDAKPVTAARAKEVVEILRGRAERPRTQRHRPQSVSSTGRVRSGADVASGPPVTGRRSTGSADAIR